MARPKSWRHGNAIFVKRRGKFRLVIFNHVLARLTDEEICAVAACAIGRINRCHNAARLFFFIGLSTLFWWGLAFLSEKTWFYASLNIEPSLAIPNGAINPGLLFLVRTPASLRLFAKGRQKRDTALIREGYESVSAFSRLFGPFEALPDLFLSPGCVGYTPEVNVTKLMLGYDEELEYIRKKYCAEAT